MAHQVEVVALDAELGVALEQELDGAVLPVLVRQLREPVQGAVEGVAVVELGGAAQDHILGACHPGRKPESQHARRHSGPQCRMKSKHDADSPPYKVSGLLTLPVFVGGRLPPAS